MPKPLRVCLGLPGQPCTRLTRNPRCPTHRRARYQAQDAHRPTTTQRGYGAQHQRQAAAQIIRQPWCSRCGQGRTQVHARGDKLTGHHLLDANGKRLDPPRYDTLCGRCNSAVGGANRPRS